MYFSFHHNKMAKIQFKCTYTQLGRSHRGKENAVVPHPLISRCCLWKVCEKIQCMKNSLRVPLIDNWNLKDKQTLRENIYEVSWRAISRTSSFPYSLLHVHVCLSIIYHIDITFNCMRLIQAWHLKKYTSFQSCS